MTSKQDELHAIGDASMAAFFEGDDERGLALLREQEAFKHEQWTIEVVTVEIDGHLESCEVWHER